MKSAQDFTNGLLVGWILACLLGIVVGVIHKRQHDVTADEFVMPPIHVEPTCTITGTFPTPDSDEMLALYRCTRPTDG